MPAIKAKAPIKTKTPPALHADQPPIKRSRGAAGTGLRTDAKMRTDGTMARPTAKSPRSEPKEPRPDVKRGGPRAEAPPPRSGQTRDPERTSSAIMAASIKEFTEKGYEGARIDSIARRAGINKRMLYHYFGNKEALYVAVLEGTYTAIRSAEHGLRLPERDPVEAMRDLVLFTWRYYLAHPEFLSLLNTENLHRAKFLKRSARIFALNSPLIEQISVLLLHGAEDGVFRPHMDAVKVYVSIAALGFFYLSNRWTLSTIFRRDLLAKEELDDWGEHMVDVTLRFLKAT